MCVVLKKFGLKLLACGMDHLFCLEQHWSLWINWSYLSKEPVWQCCIEYWPLALNNLFGEGVSLSTNESLEWPHFALTLRVPGCAIFIPDLGNWLFNARFLLFMKFNFKFLYFNQDSAFIKHVDYNTIWDLLVPTNFLKMLCENYSEMLGTRRVNTRA